MQRDVGNKPFPIWLLGESNPKQWEMLLETPLDPRHPARHSIWTSVLDVIQDKVYRECHNRVETGRIYIRNAVEDSDWVKHQRGRTVWEGCVEQEIDQFSQLLRRYRPALLLSFSAFAFEFARRALQQGPVCPFEHWGARSLGSEFQLRIARFDPQMVNLLPLLHVTIARGKWRQSQDYFCGYEGANYFTFVGNTIAEKLIAYRDVLPVWIDSASDQAAMELSNRS